MSGRCILWEKKCGEGAEYDKTKSEFAAKNRETVFVYKDLIIKW